MPGAYEASAPACGVVATRPCRRGLEKEGAMWLREEDDDFDDDDDFDEDDEDGDDDDDDEDWDSEE
jgi:hypothetical protein